MYALIHGCNMDNSNEAQMEGYLQKRFKSGIVKTLKRKWYVLKDGELRCYQSKDACQQNGEMYQDCLPVCNIQTVRAASESHGVEVVTQQKIFILVALCAEDQQRWIKAIYEIMKDNRPRSVSGPLQTTDKSSVGSPRKKRSSTGSKVSISRILPMFNRKSLDENQDQGQSQFYVGPESEKPVYAEISVQANVTQNSKFEKVEDEEELACDVFDTQDTSTEQETKVEKSREGDHLTETGQGSSICFDRESPADNLEIAGYVASADDSPSEVASEQRMDDDMSYDTKEKGMQELALMLRSSSLLVSEEEGDEDRPCYEGDDDDDDDDDDIDLEDSDGIFNDDETENGKSAFEQLQELLLKT